MVFFCCEGCNETLKKNQVAKHALKCRSCQAVTCVDCSQTFWGDDFEAHTVCISEAEKYEGSLYKAKKITKANPQEVWMTVVESAAQQAANAPAAIRQHLSRLCDFGNVPRNQKKFGNFVKNSLKIYSEVIIDQLWKYLEVLNTTQRAEAASEGTVANEVKSEADKDKGGAVTHVEAETEAEAAEEDDEERKRAKKLKKEEKKLRKEKRLRDEEGAELHVQKQEDLELKKPKKHKKSKQN